MLPTKIGSMLENEKSTFSYWSKSSTPRALEIYLGVLPFCGFNARQFRTQEMLRPQFKLFGPNQLVTVFRVDLDKSDKKVSFEIKVDVKIIIIINLV